MRPYWLPALLAIFCTANAASDGRGLKPVDLDTPRQLSPLAAPGDWPARQADLRVRALASAGLWPLPDRTPLNPRIFGRVERDAYSVEKVYFESFPGFFVTGNLYRPLGASGRHPGIVSPHGHWDHGRLEETANGSIPARCVQLARMGMVVFAYDMIGYNDACQFSPLNADGSLRNARFYDSHTALWRDPTNELWNLSLCGMQLWDSIRAVDFVASLPDVDAERIGATGASGGGSQTFLLGAVDSRVKALVPVVMVSHLMQGGCRCENMPGLRVDFSNLDFAAAAAPRPLMLIGDTGDWTRDQTEIEAPAIAAIYQALGVPDHFRAVRFVAGHNYNQTSREAMYPWFARWLQGKPDAEKIAESSHPVESDSVMRVFPDNRPPAGALTEAQFAAAWVRARTRALDALRPVDAAGVARFRDGFAFPAWNALAQAYSAPLWNSDQKVTGGEALARTDAADRVPYFVVATDAGANAAPPRWAAILAAPAGLDAFRVNGPHARLTGSLAAAGYTVMAIELHQTGAGRDAAIARRSPFTNFFDVYNRTVAQQRVRDFLTANVYAKRVLAARQTVFIGFGETGLAALLAAPEADAVAVDANGLDTGDDRAWLDPERFLPGVRSAGGPAVSLAASPPKPALIHNTADRFDVSLARAVYAAGGAAEMLSVASRAYDDEAVYRWIRQRAPLK